MEIGAQAECVYVVLRSDLASEVALSVDDTFPEVLATSRLVGIMEVAAARLMKPLVNVDQLSVGVGINLKHSAPTPVGEAITAIAKYLGMDGKLYSFEIDVFDRGGKVATAIHTRAIVDARRIGEIAAARMEKAEKK